MATRPAATPRRRDRPSPPGRRSARHPLRPAGRPGGPAHPRRRRRHLQHRGCQAGPQPHQGPVPEPLATHIRQLLPARPATTAAKTLGGTAWLVPRESPRSARARHRAEQAVARSGCPSASHVSPPTLPPPCRSRLSPIWWASTATPQPPGPRAPGEHGPTTRCSAPRSRRAVSSEIPGRREPWECPFSAHPAPDAMAARHASSRREEGLPGDPTAPPLSPAVVRITIRSPLTGFSMIRRWALVARGWLLTQATLCAERGAPPARARG
jgi:hypothetical protein